MINVLDKNVLSRKEIDKRIYIPFGLEIETEGISFDEGKRLLQHKISDGWIIGDDRTLDNRGLELTSPILPNNKEVIKQLKKISETLKYLNPSFKRASFQINFSVDENLGDNIVSLLKMFYVYQNVIYRFSTGVDDKMRETVAICAFPLLFKSRLISVDETLVNNKFFALSLKTLTENKEDSIKVIEFRTPNGTDNFYLWMNYIIFFSSFLTCIKNETYDREYIDYKFNNIDYWDKKKKYDCNDLADLAKIDEYKAIEFADLIYMDEAEKQCFYSQYFDKKIRTR